MTYNWRQNNLVNSMLKQPNQNQATKYIMPWSM